MGDTDPGFAGPGELYQAIFDEAPLGMALGDPMDGRVLAANRALCEMLGYRHGELVGGNLLALTHPDDRAATAEQMRRVARGESSGFDLEKRYLRKDGGSIRIHSALKVMPRADGSPRHAIVVVQDIGRRRQVAEASPEGEEPYRDIVETGKGQFLSRMSHELRTPLNAILGFAQLMAMEPNNPEQQQMLGHILASGRHLLNLIDGVLDISRVEQARLALSLEAVEVVPLLHECLAQIDPPPAERGVEVELDERAARGLGVRADRRRLKQVLLSLLSNAVKYNRAGGRVTVRCEVREQGAGGRGQGAGGKDAEAATGSRQPATRLRIGVSDTGPGVPPEQISRLFKPFERLEAAGDGIRGTGLGLTLARLLAEAMGGSVGVESSLGQGSTFWVEMDVSELPLQVAEPAAAETNAMVPRAAPGTKTVLYVEDNPSNVKLVERVLAMRPRVRLIAAAELPDLAAFGALPDLILLDLQLPNVPGELVLEQLRASPATRHIPVVILSADASPWQIKHLLEAGAAAYLTKPLDVRQFLGLLDEVLRGSAE